MNCDAERWVQSVNQGCLDHFIVFGEAHLRYIFGQYESWFNEECAHQEVCNVRLRQIGAEAPPAEVGQGTIVCRERLSGLRKHYHRQVA